MCMDETDKTITKFQVQILNGIKGNMSTKIEKNEIWKD